MSRRARRRFFRGIVMFVIFGCMVATGRPQAVAQQKQGNIVHDAEYYILEAQNGEKWAAEDKELDKKLAELQKKYGQPPNIVYILWDDTAFGAVGFPGQKKSPNKY